MKSTPTRVALSLTILFATCWTGVCLGELQSAFLLRSAQPVQVPATNHMRNKRLKRHFDDVLELLESNANSSMVACVREFEQRYQTRFSVDQRENLRRQLAAAREANVRRLREYRDRGVFPQNHSYVTATPIFVDDNNTACAVGHLMRKSGWEKEVREIAQSNNLICIADVNDGKIVDWILTSGLTQLEAALIQPQYYFGDHVLSELQSFGTYERHGVRYSNFQLQTSVTGSGGVVDSDSLGAIFGNPVEPDWFGTSFHEIAFEDANVGNRWIFFGRQFGEYIASVGQGGSASLVLSYDIEVVDSTNDFVGLSTIVTPSPGSSALTMILEPQPEDYVAISTVANNPDGGQLAFHQLDRDDMQLFSTATQNLFLDELVTSSFEPTKNLSVAVEIELSKQLPDAFALFGTFAIAAAMVPEPSSVFLSLLASLVLLFARAHR